jgi:pilus assembly protein Flp/PilA
MKVLIARFACDESGATAVEYGLIAAAMFAAIITMMLGLGSKLTATFASVPVGLK